MNKFENLNEEELIKLLNRGNLTEEEFSLLVKSMETKGLKGIISEVDPDDPEGKEMIEYINFHERLPKDYQSKTQIKKAQELLVKDKIKDLNKLKIAIMVLAHSGELKSLKILQKHAKNLHPNLHIWVKMAIDECQTFLESELLDKPMIKLFPAEPKITKEQILRRRKEIEQELSDLLKKHQSQFDLDYIKDAIYSEEDQDDMMKVVVVFDRGRPDELSNVLELATDAWNYFPHKSLNGLSPIEMINEFKLR